MNEYPNIRTGTRFGDTSAADWQKVMADLAQLKRMVFGDSNVQATPSGIRETARTLDQLLRFQPRTVVITKKPVEGDKFLTVREAKYKELPPTPCTGSGASAACFYEWIGPEFEAYPPLGLKPIDFVGDENTTAVETPPKFDTKFHRIHREYDVWVLERPAAGGSAITFCVVVGPAPGLQWGDPSDFFRIVHMKKNPNYGTSPGEGLPIDTVTHVWVGIVSEPLGYSLVQCFPGTKQSDWQYFQGVSGYTSAGPILMANAPFFTTKMIGGVEYITPEVFAEAGNPDSGTLPGDC